MGPFNTSVYSRVFHFTAMQRSGHHAVIYWLARRLNSRTLFLNNCLWMKDNEPSSIHNLGKVQEQATQPGVLIWSSENLPLEDCHPIYLTSEHYCIVCREKTPELQHHTCKNNFQHPNLIRLHSNVKQNEILIVRSTENWVASMLKYWRERRYWETGRKLRLDEFSRYVDIFKTHLRACLRKNRRYEVIIFDAWFKEEQYRELICSRLQLDLAPSGSRIDYLSRHGRGSSFDGFKFAEEPSEMKVLDRWEYYKDDEEYLSILADALLLDLSRRVFGKYTRIESIIS